MVIILFACLCFFKISSRHSEILLTSLLGFFFLKTLLVAKHDDFYKRNLEASSNLCSALLQEIFGPLEDSVNRGAYSKPGGHSIYLQKVEELKAKYYQKPRKGIQVSLVCSAIHMKYLK